MKNYLPVLSELTCDEISKAPEPVQQTLRTLLEFGPEVLEITEATLDLSEGTAFKQYYPFQSTDNYELHGKPRRGPTCSLVFLQNLYRSGTKPVDLMLNNC